MLTERENALRMIRRSGDAQWISDDSLCFTTVFPTAMNERPRFLQDGVDWFGCKWYWEHGTGGHMQRPDLDGVPIPDITRWEEYLIVPDFASIDFEAAAKRDMANVDRENTLVNIMMESGPFERIIALLSMEEALASMYEEPECFKALINRLTDIRVELIDRIAAAYKPDIILQMDDLGSERAPLISVDMYRELIKPCHIRQSEAIHRNGCIHLQHSCGRMAEFIEDLLEVGVDMIHPLQDCNDHAACLEKYGDRVTFYGCTGRVKSRADATPEEVRADIRRVCDLFGPYKNCIVQTGCGTRELTSVQRAELADYGHRIYLP